VKNSFYVIGSLEIYNSYFISNCKNIDHCLFCNNIEQQNFMLFNKPISEEEYNNYLIQLLKLKGPWIPHFIDTWGEKKMPLMPPLLDNEEDYCSDIPKELLNWLETLPGFDEKILKDILKI
jgi:hypothetical protein